VAAASSARAVSAAPGRCRGSRFISAPMMSHTGPAPTSAGGSAVMIANIVAMAPS
jgi:hypothetical protein